ncbi:GNAT family N-acetyltransferase [Miniphocaeibacter massiliensis]|uniref:GNAT family N-acetyltransferase n=1 Tax=Miniphocaeibacter massiliensis TaxID=2041841 RepID=UPI000C0717E1|nr:GNAT family N-acetyltransferase [Miniphocaeibacter massiliensis]
MKFRKATTNDIEALVELRKQQLIDEGMLDDKNIDNELKEYFYHNFNNNSYISWIAIEQGNIIATSGLCIYQLPPTYANPSGKKAYITNMYTLKKYRRMGLATILLTKILSEAKNLNFSDVILKASKDGLKLYSKFGFIFYDN